MKLYSGFAIILSLILIPSLSDAQVRSLSDSLHHNRFKYRYLMMCFFTGTGLSVNHADGGLFQVSFPYSTLLPDGTISHTIFTSDPKNLNHSVKAYYLPFIVQTGTERHFFNFFFSGFSQGGAFTAGYGRVWNSPMGNSGKDDIIFHKKWLFKSSLNVCFEGADFEERRSLLGIINNDDRTIYALGDSAAPFFRTKGSRNNKPRTYASRELHIVYTQSELSLLPILSVINNPFRSQHTFIDRKEPNVVRRTGKLTCELSLGYKIRIADWGGIEMKQTNGDHEEYLPGTARLNNAELAASYNSHPITKVPFHFSGLYVSFVFHRAGTWIKRRSHT